MRSVPLINGLRVENFIDLIETETGQGKEYLPEHYKEITFNRKWVVNLCKI